MKVNLTLFSLTFFAFALSCGAVTKEDFERRTASLESRIAQLEEKQKLLEERSLRMESRIDALSENLAGVRLDLERLKLKSGEPTETALKLPEVKKEPTPQKQQETVQKRESSPPAEDYQKEYEEAIRLYNLRQLNQAKDKLIDFIKKHPKTPLTDNAYFWLGVIYRDLGELNKAEAVWLTLVERCQRKEMVDCNKAPATLLQLARLYEQRGESQKSKEFYEAILRDYPLSEEASTAKTKLGR